MHHADQALRGLDNALEDTAEVLDRLQAARDALEPPHSIDTGAGEKYRRVPRAVTLAEAASLTMSLELPAIEFGGLRAFAPGGNVPGQAADVDVEAASSDQAEPEPPPPIEPGPELAAARGSAPKRSSAHGERIRTDLEQIVAEHPDGLKLPEILDAAEAARIDLPSAKSVRNHLGKLVDAGKLEAREIIPGQRKAGLRYAPKLVGVRGSSLPASPPARRRHRTRPTELREESTSATQARHDRAVLTILEKGSPEWIHPGPICKAARLAAVEVEAALLRLLEDDRIEIRHGRPSSYRPRPA